MMMIMSNNRIFLARLNNARISCCRCRKWHLIGSLQSGKQTTIIFTYASPLKTPETIIGLCALAGSQNYILVLAYIISRMHISNFP